MKVSHKSIFNSSISKSLKKPPKLDNYDWSGDLGEHIKHVDTIINYYYARWCEMKIIRDNRQSNYNDMVQIPPKRKHKLLEGTLRICFLLIHYSKWKPSTIAILNRIQ